MTTPPLVSVRRQGEVLRRFKFLDNVLTGRMVRAFSDAIPLLKIPFEIYNATVTRLLLIHLQCTLRGETHVQCGHTGPKGLFKDTVSP